MQLYDIIFIRGITPAYAGKTKNSVSSSLSSVDHPRLRGKDPIRRIKAISKIGSPPLTRERPFAFQRIFLTGRITPAYAGKTPLNPQHAELGQDHPRLRGKDSLCVTTTGAGWGSPPLTRERLHCLKYTMFLLRITPAYAGKTYCSCNSI